MRWRREIVHIVNAVMVLVILSACTRREAPGPAPDVSPTVAQNPPTAEEVKKAEEALQQAADKNRQTFAALTFEEFKSKVYKEPFEGGKYIVNGDTPILNEKQLREFFEEHVKPPQPTLLIVHQVSGMDAVWNQQQKRNLTFCVSTQFDSRHDAVVQDMESATQAWEQAAAVDFIHDAAQDANCSASNAAVTFDVRPVDVNEQYLARAFFPNEPRAARNVLIDESAMNLPSTGKLQLIGILRHELGHTLGFRHEHTRPASGACFEDQDWRPLTDYDAFSVMHYPQCNGQADWALKLTDRDRNGAACLYGAATGFTVDGTLVDVAHCTVDQGGAPTPAQPQTQTFAAQQVSKNAKKQYGPFAVAAGTRFEASIGGPGATGDADLYVRFHQKPALGAYDCRPYLDTSNEVCALTVPAGESQAFVMVNGYTAAKYRLEVTHTPPPNP